MRKLAALLVWGAVLACQDRAGAASASASASGSASASASGSASAPASASGTAPAPEPAAPAPLSTACADAWLAARHLNEFGDPPGTLYAGGTPLFDETTGRRTDRLALLARKHPALAAACSAPDAGR